MKASPMSLFEEFIKESFGSQYVIPVYQRNYTWKQNKQIKQLLSDIERIIHGETRQHFIGTIVYVITDTDFMVRERAVVDGQQRLITMFLIAYALKNIAQDLKEDAIANQISSSYLENSTTNTPASIKYKYRLQTSVSDDDAYSYITEDRIDSFSGQSLLMNNYKYILSYLKNLVSQSSLMSVINAVRKIYIVRIELGIDDNAQQIFESINSTGEKLTAADLIRNYIMMNKTNSEQENIYFKYWHVLEKIFSDSKSIAAFFRFYLAAKTYVLISDKELYSKFKIYWEEQLGTHEYLEILTDIINYAHHYERLYIKETKDEIGIALQDYRKLHSDMPAPFAMSLLEHYRKQEVSKEQVVSTLKILVTYLVRRYINGQDTSAISRFFPSLLKNIEDQLEIEKSYKKFVDIFICYLVNENKGKTAFMPDDNQIRIYLQTANAYALANTRWVLDKIEAHNNPAPVDLSQLNIEHIMPQTSNDYWTKISGLEADEYIDTVNKLGNLTLAAATDNSKMGNKDFNSKKKVLENTSHLKLNEDILKKDLWTPKDIDERTKVLTDKIIKLFPYVKSSYTITGKDAKRYVSLNSKGITAIGYLNEDESLTVYQGSQVNLKTKPSSTTLLELRDDLKEDNILEEINGKLVFSQSYTFNSPSGATDFILGGSNNGWNYWKDDNGVIINTSLRKQ
ncbi:DUF4357 domain-containing protein [Phascolarctobacterium sp.]|uniref:DUF4357 domain-containing protein n=1 Tax=Phascolarctobacterium sp. TaxID=2049039 RepID=UPI003077A6ED